MKNTTILFALLTAFCHPEGTAAQVINLDGTTTRAVVIGISDYQDAAIPDLRFADRDAEAFANFLRSPGGGSLQDDKIKVLTNEKATMAQMAAALDWLMTKSGEGDLAIIFFSGHGDVETKTRSQLGFLLNWDAPAHAYMARAYPIYYLQEIVATLTLDKKSRVLLVTDACRSGNLAGSAINGAQLTNANLAVKFANEVKILSCQPNEYSFEGEQWGGGRGVFSFFLVDGLYGLADDNADGMVNLLEIGRFLEDKVSGEATPAPQLPMTVGPKTETVAFIDQDLLAALKNGGFDDLTAALDLVPDMAREAATTLPPAFKDLHLAFYKSLEQNFDFNKTDSLYRLLEKAPALADYQAEYKRKFAAAIHDEVNQALNALLESDPYQVNNFLFKPENYSHYPERLQRSIELVGEDNLITPSLRVKKLFFEAYNITRLLSESDKFERPVRDSLRRTAHKLIEKAIALEPSAAWLHYGNGYFYSFRTPSQIDSVLKYSEEALRLSPKWLLPMLTVAGEYMYNLHDYDKAAAWLLRARQVNPESFVVVEHLAWLYQTIGPKDKAMEMSDKMIALRPDLFNGYGTKAGNYFQLFDFTEAEKWYQKAAELNADPNSWVHYYLGYIYLATRQVKEGKTLFERMVADPRTPYWMVATYSTWYAKGLINFTQELPKAEALLADALHRRHIPYDMVEILVYQAKAKYLQGQWEETRLLLDQALGYDTLSVSSFILAYALMGELEARDGNAQKAEEYFVKGTTYLGDEFFKEEAVYRYGVFLLNENRLDEAEKQFLLCQSVTHHHGFWGEYGLALLNARQGKTDLVLYQLEQALERYYPLKAGILAEPLFLEVQQDARFVELMKKYFQGF